MLLGHDWTWWLPIFSVVAALLSVAAGTLAIFQEHHTHDGKLTRFGWTLAALIFASGAASLGLGVVDRRIGDEKEHADAAERDRQFGTQMATLQGVTGSLSQLQTDMRGSLGQQQRQFDVANRTLGMSEALQRQAQANTLSVLRRVFAESNRISAERIAVSVAFNCISPDDPYRGLPELQTATLVVRGASGGSVTLSTTQKLVVGSGTVFHGFLGDLGPFETFPAWRNARIEIQLVAELPISDGYRIEEVLQMDALSRQRGGRAARPPSCTGIATLLLNGRQVLSASQNFQQTPELDYVAHFSDLSVDSNRLPHFAL
jgi:hypothetical protein